MKAKQILVVGSMDLNDPLILKLKEKQPEIVVLDSVKRK